MDPTLARWASSPRPEDFFPVVFMQQPLKHGVQAVLKEEARAVRDLGYTPKGLAVHPVCHVSLGAPVRKTKHQVSAQVAAEDTHDPEPSLQTLPLRLPPLIWEVGHSGSCCDLCQRVFCLCFTLRVL